jgi:hypothetical protein
MEFEPLRIAKDGHNFIIGGFQQYLTYGLYSGYCDIDGQVIKIEK